MTKRLLILVFTLVVIAGGVYYFFDPKVAVSTKVVDVDKADPQANKLYQALQMANYIEQGAQDAPHKMYVIFDPNCKFCHALFESVQMLVQQKSLAIRWVPIGIIKQSSPTKVMAILSAKLPIEALKQNEDGFDYANEEGGITPLEKPTNKQIEQFNQNMTVLKGLINAVPVVIYKNRMEQVRVSGGALLPLRASNSALVQNEQKMAEFMKQISKSW